MAVLCFGALNIDYLYEVVDFVKEEETIHSKNFTKKCGGKGLNQAVALSKAGIKTYLAGAISPSGSLLLECCKKHRVNTEFIMQTSKVETGHAVIQVDTKGQNCILLYSGANHCIERSHIDKVFEHFKQNDYILLQNEINNIGYIMHKAREKGMIIVFNPSPMNTQVLKYPLNLVDIFVMNKIEGMTIANYNGDDYQDLISLIAKKFPTSQILLTLGNKGAMYTFKNKTYFQNIYDSPVIDSTGAGDTFTGYFISQLIANKSIETALMIASKAAALAVSKRGTTESIPDLQEVLTATF